MFQSPSETFQYRKRYLRVATYYGIDTFNEEMPGFNTASGIYVLQLIAVVGGVYIMVRFQYRKRYLRVATDAIAPVIPFDHDVSIPQAVFTRCNRAMF